MFIGFYDLANFITLTGLASSVAACFMAFAGNLQIAVMLFMLSGICDCFDGPVARRSKKRDEKKSVFGVQIDTVSDMVSFGVTPAILLLCMGMHDIIPIFHGGPVLVAVVCMILIFYVMCAAVRLAYFNMLEITKTDKNAPKTFTGMPVPFSAIVFPLLFLGAVTLPIPGFVSAIFIIAFYFLTAILFISNFVMKKPTGFVYYLYPVYGIALVVLYIIFGGRLNV